MANFASAINNYNTVTFKFPRREKYSPGRFTFYRRFFNGCRWELALRPSKSIDDSWEDAKNHDVNRNLKEFPGVYEFAIAKRLGGKRLKVYLGETVNMHDRQTAHLSGRSNIGVFMNDAVRQGFYIYRRVRYINPRGPKNEGGRQLQKVMAKQIETRILGKYNYAWNSDENGTTDMTRTPVKTSFLCFSTGIKWIRNQGVQKFEQ